MASPRSQRAGVTLSSGKALSLTPGSRVLQTPLADEAIWRRLKEAGFDEESIKRRDKAALIAYIAKLEAEVCLLLSYQFSRFILHFVYSPPFSYVFLSDGLRGIWN